VDKHSSCLRTFLNYNCNFFLSLEPNFIIFMLNVIMLSVIMTNAVILNVIMLDFAILSVAGPTYLVVSSRCLRATYLDPRTIFKTLQFLVNLQMAQIS
jgi:hypothetical protein